MEERKVLEQRARMKTRAILVNDLRQMEAQSLFRILAGSAAYSGAQCSEVANRGASAPGRRRRWSDDTFAGGAIMLSCSDGLPGEPKEEYLDGTSKAPSAKAAGSTRTRDGETGEGALAHCVTGVVRDEGDVEVER